MGLFIAAYAAETRCFVGRDFDSSVDVALKRGLFNISSEEYFLFYSSFQNIKMFHLQEKEEIFGKAYIDWTSILDTKN